MTPPVLSIAVDVSQIKKAMSSSAFGSSQQIDNVIKRFSEVGIRIDRTSKSINGLAARMNDLARDEAFKKFAQDAKLSALEIAKIRAGIGDLRGAYSTLSNAIGESKLAIVAWGASLVVAGKAILDAQIAFQRLENSYKAVFGSGAASQLDMVYQQVDRVGLKFFDTANAAKSFFAAGQDTKLAPELENIFKALTDTGAALQLSTEEVNGAFVALGQMISKGKVQAEELRGQLGERLPGAFQMAAKAMGMTTAELDKFMADGKLTAEQLLPALAEALEEKYGRAAAEAANTAQGAINRMSNEWELFKKNVMDSGPMIDMINAVTDALASMNKQKRIQAERDRAIEFLKKEGMKPEGVKSDVQVLPDGTIIQPEVYLEQYSERQIKAAIEYEKSQNRVNAYIEQGQKEEAEAISKGRAAIAKALKNTAEYQITALRNERDILIADIDKSIEAYKAQGKDTSSLLADRDKVIQVYNQKIEDAGKKGAKSAKSAAVSQADYNGELERTRQTIDSLQQQLGLDKTEDLARAKIRIEQQYQATLSKTNEELTKQVAQGKLTQAQADTLKGEKAKAAELQKQVALRDAEQKAQERQYKDLQTAADFYKELADLSGSYGQSIEYQNQLIEHQAQLYRTSGIPEALVQQWEALKKLETARDPWSGFARTTNKYFADATNWAERLGSIWGNTMDGMTDALTEFCMTGKLNFNDLANSFIQQVIRMQMQAAVSGLFKGMTSFVGELFGFGGNMDSLVDTATSAMQAIPGIGHSGWYVGRETPADGFRSVPAMAFAGAPRLHSGGGLFRSDEYPAILQRGERVLNRDETAAYHAGMQAGGYGGSQVVVVEPQVHIENNTASTVRTETSMSGGVPRIDVFIDEIDSRLADMVGSGRSRLGRAIDMTRGTNRARSTY